MSEKNYTPEEAAKKVLEKCQEMYNSQKIEKAETIEKSNEELEKIGGGAGTPGSVATTGGPSIASQIGFGKTDEKEMHPKLKSFIEKRKAKKAAKMEKMMGIGEKAPVASPAPKAAPMGMSPKAPLGGAAQTAAPVNAPKPAVSKVGGQMSKKEKK